jgi:hypothetical protein
MIKIFLNARKPFCCQNVVDKFNCVVYYNNIVVQRKDDWK